MSFTPTQIAACPVAAIVRQSTAAFDRYDAAQREIFDDPNTPRKAELEAKMERLWGEMQAFEEATTHLIASSKVGLAYHATLIRAEADYCVSNDPEDCAPSRARAWRLSELICRSIASMPEDGALNPAHIAPSYIVTPPPRVSTRADA
jgi:hypothetical protein